MKENRLWCPWHLKNKRLEELNWKQKIKKLKKKKDAKKAGKAPKKTEAEEFMDDRKAVGPSEIVIKIQD